MRITFDVVKLRVSRGYKCKSCGKSRSKVLKVEYTVNPFNRRNDGTPKTREEVYQDVKREINRKIEQLAEYGAICSKCD